MDEDCNKTSFCIPFDPPEIQIDVPSSPRNALPNSPFSERDLHDGPQLRFEAYRTAWEKCMTRITGIVQELQRSTLDAVVKEVKASYMKTLPALPHPELPIISVVNPALGENLMENICAALESPSNDVTDNEILTSSVIHLRPADFQTISAGMRGIVSGFVDKDPDTEQIKRRASTSLANYDIGTLEAWHRFRSHSQGNIRKPTLCVVLHDFEQIDPDVMQNVFYTCSKASPQLPLIFILVMSSPLTNFINLAYPRSILCRLRIRHFAAPSGPTILQEIWTKTFFDISFDPDVMFGPPLLEYLQDYFNRHNASVDAILTILQLAHLKHFSLEPLRLFVKHTPANTLSQPSAFVDALRVRLRLASKTREKNSMDVDEQDFRAPEDLITAVDKSRTEFHNHARNIRIAFGIIERIQVILERHGHKGLGWSGEKGSSSAPLEAILDILRDRSGRDVKHLVKLTRRLNAHELEDIIDELNTYFFNMPSHVRVQEQETRSHLTLLRSQIPRVDDEDADTENIQALSQRFSDWFSEYMNIKLVPIEEGRLWDIWYTGRTSVVSEILNPSVRASIIAGLLRPYEFQNESSIRSSPITKALWQLPDTSILFKRYLDSSKMINVYDWFESFKSVLDLQRIHLQEAEVSTRSSSPRKKGRSGNRAGKGKQKEPAPMSEEEEERWKTFVHARFIRALHELDYLGLLKHTGRKADHVLRTVFEIDDDGDDGDQLRGPD
ncbi:origin recognition complex subunit 3 N-terminus-domain-containing protein [Crepidotus variabilis]|uniref:Origin recognition complex subunit 3 N-terminus-domain-containing protein n=1 Tax=Crepidotus variabilis TaxID=179855 RepID=A0A9P6E4C5_9AGAR|nr:origin recognition complex subunit 3 N-terminus-domain-containing protein [Crepidotus variabilis]